MDNEQRLLEELKSRVSEQSNDIKFIHYKWFVKYHLEIVEAIAMELYGKYQQANKLKVLVLAWLHDYEKIVDFNNQHNTDLVATADIMKQVGFDQDFVRYLCTSINVLNAKDNLKTAPIEVQIVSSADAASHFVGPFGSLYWYENPEQPVEKIQAERIRKISVDWEKKVTLPEIKKAFQDRYNFAKESVGQLPENYLI